MRRYDQNFKDLYPFDSKYCTLNSGHRMAYLDEGESNNEVFLMLHGNPSWSFYYRRLVLAFRGKYRVIVPDHIGMGFSDKPQNYEYSLQNHIANLQELLVSLLSGNEKVNLLVHDWGGAIGMGWAVEHICQVDKLVVLNTAAFRSQKIPLRINICRIPLLGALAVRGLNAFAGAATFMAVEKKMSAEVKAGFLLPYNNWKNRIATLRFVEDIPLTPEHRSYSTLKEIEEKLLLLASKKMLILWGGKDWCFDDSFFKEWVERFPEAETEYYADGGHYILEDEHEKIIPRIEQFLN